MKYFVIFSLLIFLCSAALAEVYFEDVPKGHWGADAVYELVRLGVTSGFPDGTFRGKREITRFEIAAFLSKFSRAFRLQRAKNEKLLAELKNELALVKYKREKAEYENKISGTFDSQLKAALGSSQQLLRSRGGAVQCRLRLDLTKNFSPDAALKIGLDTMDAGFSASAQRDLAAELLDFEGRVKLGGMLLKMSFGPGEVVHLDSGLFPAENNIVYNRPKRAVSIAASSDKTDFSLDYLVRSSSSNGLIEISEISSKLAANFSRLKLFFNPRCFYNAEGEKDWRLDLGGEVEMGAFAGDALVGIAKTTSFPHGLYLRADLKVGEEFHLTGQRIGAQYREKFSYGIFDLFDRNLSDGSTNIGMEFHKSINQHWFVKARGDYMDPGSILTTEIKLGWQQLLPCDIAPKSAVPTIVGLALVYQNYKSTGVSEAMGIELSLGF